MPDRNTQATVFLERGPWVGARRAPLAGDASNRRYERVTRPSDGATAVLMDAPPDTGEAVKPFVSIANHLTAAGFSAPRVLDQDIGNGFLLLEDLGDDLFARVLKRETGVELQLYEVAIDALADLHRIPLPAGIERYGPAQMTATACFAYDWYCIGTELEFDAKKRFCRELETLLITQADGSDVLALRDFHAENLIWLPGRHGVARAGMLDFQDAAAGHPAYDLVSLLKDARLDVDPNLEVAMKRRFIARTHADADKFNAAYAVLGAQRNLRILGVFSRLSVRDGKPAYVDLIPRVWGHLMRSLDHPVLANLAGRVRSDLPPPTPAHLQSLKDRCATIPTP